MYRHQALMRAYASAPAAERVAPHDLQVLQSEFQFIRDDEADARAQQSDWKVRMSVRYYRQLFREYALADLSRYETGQIGLRWRTEMEVVAGKGQFSCGNKRCDERTGLHSYELLFAYVEQGERKRCLVKVRVCSNCAGKLFYKKLKARAKHKRKKQEKTRSRQEGQQTAVAAASDSAKRKRACDPSESEASDSDVSSDDVHAICREINEHETRALRAAESREEVGVEAKASDERASAFLRDLLV